eukprot:SAG31_NODE_10453_length_1134_cov_7.979749_1_plen_69_part_00
MMLMRSSVSRVTGHRRDLMTELKTESVPGVACRGHDEAFVPRPVSPRIDTGGHDARPAPAPSKVSREN